MIKGSSHPIRYLRQKYKIIKTQAVNAKLTMNFFFCSIVIFLPPILSVSAFLLRIGATGGGRASYRYKSTALFHLRSILSIQRMPLYCFHNLYNRNYGNRQSKRSEEVASRQRGELKYGIKSRNIDDRYCQHKRQHHCSK